MKEERKLGYRRISYILNEKGFKSIRSNKILKNDYTYSIYYKGKLEKIELIENLIVKLVMLY